ncbi:MAG: glycosyltransferase family 2 protein [Prevotella sp.]|jgi:glycosyltransferase involved in cell wall biosynthesis|nr:glycosyltransferase family 2 protein [Prevotella sp.]
MDGFSVIMPTYNQGCFIRRAILSLFQQTYTQWELIIINDGSTDNTEQFIADFLNKPKVIYIKNTINQGLGYAINQGLNIANYRHIAYLPSDDFYYVDHLERFKEKFDESENIALVYSGMRYDLNDTVANAQKYETIGLREGYSLQLVQAAHIKTEDRWLERSEWVTENLFLMFWHKLMDKGDCVATNKISSCWTNHTHQRHKIIYEEYKGGLNYYRRYYNVQEPIRIRVSPFRFIDEIELYKNMRGKTVLSSEPLKILLVGELAFNPDRVYALEQAGHQLYGLWIERPSYSSTTVGHLPFGNVIDIPYENFENEIKKINPDIIYGLLNWGAIPLAYEVLTKCSQIPFVWHFKESHSHAMRNGLWEKLIYLYTHADGNIFINNEVKLWYEQFIPNLGISYIMDGDLPKKEYFSDDYTSKISAKEKGIHTVVPGRVVGISAEDVKSLAQEDVHIHIYTENDHYYRMSYLYYLKKAAPKHIHLHSHCTPENWVKELSRYDAGWLHYFKSDNFGNILNTSWDDLNVPARIPTLAAACLPMIQKNNQGHLVATQNILKQKDIGILFNDINELCALLKDQDRMNVLRDNLKRQRNEFHFDNYVPSLISFFKKVISNSNKEKYDI